VLAANVIPQIGTPLYPELNENRLQPYTVKEIDGEKVGIIGIDIASKTQNSSSPLNSTIFLDEVETAQTYIDELADMGVNKIILLTHYQYQNDLAMAAKLKGVDVIVGGDSHTLLGDFDAYGLNSSGDYPTKVTDADGNPVCVVQAWQYAQIVGELNVSFDADGVVESCSGTPHLLVEPVAKNGVAITEVEKTEAQALIVNEANLRYTEADSATAALLQSYSDEVEVLAQEKIAEAVSDLCLERIPGQGRSGICSAEDTKPHGGDIQQLVALAFYEMDPKADIGIQNAGGVRIDVPAGDITVETAYTLLPFANTLVELEMTGAQVKQVLEEAVDFALNPEGSTGAYPYAAGLRWDMDLSQAVGNRLSNLEFKARGTDTWMTFDEAATYIVLTNNYIAGGKDGYFTFADITGDKYIDTFLDYAQSFSDYAKAVETVEKLPYSEYSTQNFTDTEGTLYPTKAVD
jgi:5'-nucleotidase